MKFLVDHDVYFVTAQFLRQQGHDVIRVAEIGKAKAADSELLQIAQETDRIFVTRDRDFGALVFVRKIAVGVIYLRVPYPAVERGHRELLRVLQKHTEDELKTAFVVVEPERHRFRKIPQ
ncbi:MAG: DUF5615 family PIN-like protein [Anaerolineae bacterium]|nr:DUF5615 family PIN-like protein [Anaerolineae bacterium]